MKLTISRRFAIFTVLLITAMFLALGVMGFRGIQASNRALGESLLFWSVAAAAITLVLFSSFLLRATSLDRRLERLISQGNHRDLVPGRDFVSLGKLGTQLTTIFNQISRQNLLKARKISAMHDLVEFLVKNAQRPTVVCDVTGVIQYANETVQECLHIDRMDIMGERLETIAPAIPFTDLRATILQTMQPEEAADNALNYTCYPVENSADELAYMVFLFNAKARYFMKRDHRTSAGSSGMAALAAGISSLMKGVRKGS